MLRHRDKTRPQELLYPRGVHVAPDGAVFVADAGHKRVQVLSQSVEFRGVLGEAHLNDPVGVCATADFVVVTSNSEHCVSVFARADGSFVRRFGSEGSGDGQLRNPQGVCFLADGRSVAVVDYGNHRVSIFTIDGEFVRHVGVMVLKNPVGIACSPFDELVVADFRNKCIRLFSPYGELIKSFGTGDFRGVALHGSMVFAQDYAAHQCVAFV
jgi:DNA-binding beta-propeller fold protein YncE